MILCGRSEERLKKAKERLGDRAEYVVWDIADVSRARETVERAHSIFGEISVFVNNAGIVSREDNGPEGVGFFKKNESCWDETMNINLKGTFFALQAEAEYMKTRGIKGNIVNVCSEMGYRAVCFPYGISKWCVRGITVGAGRELAPLGIVVNGISPGETSTEILHQREGDLKKIESPRGIQASVEEMADSIYFLAKSRNIIGEIFVSDGGRRLF